MFGSKRDHGNLSSRLQEQSNDRSRERSRERSKDPSRERSREGSIKDRFWERSDLSRLQFLIACSMQNGGGRMSRVREGRCDGAVPDEESRGPCNILSKNLKL